MKAEVIVSMIFAELRSAEAKHPGWPEDIIHQAAILGEEAGEVLKAAIDVHYNGGSIEDLHKEVAQVGAMAFRLLMNSRKENKNEHRNQGKLK